MVNQAAPLHFPAPIIEVPPEYELKWSSISLSEVLERKTRLEASVYDIRGKQARETLARCRWELTTVTGENGLAVAYHRGRFKRVFVEKSNLPIYQPSQIMEIYPKPNLWISDKTNANLDSLRVKKNQILMTCSGTIGKCTFVSDTLDDCIFSHDLLRIETLNETDSGYLYAFLKSDVGQTLILSKNYGAVISHIEPHHLTEIPVPNPQALYKIEIHNLVKDSFALRDESNALIDRAENLLLRELNLPPFDEFKTKFVNDESSGQAFTAKLSECFERLEANFHKPIVRSISKHIKQHAAEVTTLGDSRISAQIILPSRFKRVYVEAGQGVLFFGGKELLELAPKGEKYLSLKHHDDRIKKELTLAENMVMITSSGTLGKVAITPKHWEGWTANQHIIRVVPRDETIAGYIYAWLNTGFGKELITRFSYGAVVNEIDQRHVAQIEIPLLVNKDAQQEINDLVLEANRKRSEAYLLEQKAIQTVNEKVIFAE